MRCGRGAGLAISVILLAGPAIAAASHAAHSLNPANEGLMKLPPAARAAELAQVVGHWCIGIEAFPMGIAKTGRGAGDAYWSLRCSDGSAWAIQIDPLGEFSAIGCATFDDYGAGKECFKKF